MSVVEHWRTHFAQAKLDVIQAHKFSLIKFMNN